MARTVNPKKTKIQKDKILDKALILFNKAGYEKVSVNRIIRESKISKGSFYYYFNSKDDLFNKLIERMIFEMVAGVREIAKSKLGALRKFNKAVRYLRSYKIKNRKIHKMLMLVLYKDENLKLKDSVHKRGFALIKPEVARIIRQGQKEKVFFVKNPVQSAEIILGLFINLADNLAPIFIKKKMSPEILAKCRRKTKAYNEAVEKILGIKESKISLFDINIFKEILK